MFLKVKTQLNIKRKNIFIHIWFLTIYLVLIKLPIYFYGNYRERVRKMEAQYNLPEKKSSLIPKLFTLKMETNLRYRVH